ncbi:MAG: type I DNA topoisomerase [Firmicutes bacterium]|nr:type I DNA topoisomerase [Bacillota bacterium]
MKLVVIEGAGKVKTVEKYLGKGYKVFATKGHVRDLPQKTLAVNVKKDFEPKYEIMPDKTETVKELKNLASKADAIYLATDPDREGEAISWHIANILGLSPEQPVRAEFNEISEKAVKNGLAHPRKINLNLVDAQQARRVLDRLVGYKLSPVLCKKIRNNLSAGRVQSVTLRLIVEREREIRNFKPEEYWTFFSNLKNSDHFEMRASLEKKNNKKYKIANKDELDKVLSDLKGESYVVGKVVKKVAKSHAPAPFITSSMQQDALNKLGMNLKQTSAAAQALYEGVNIGGEHIALITYIRTDSTRVSPDAQKAAREFIAKKFGEKFVPAKPNIYASKKSAQDAHEAIRPITLDRTPESLKDTLSPENYKLYKLIYERFLASQMSDAEYNTVNAEINAGNYTFKVSGKTPLFAGYTAVYSNYQEEKDDEMGVKLPVLTEGEQLAFVSHTYEQKFTKPPARYTEASLVKTMEEKGIGRPATYTPTVALLFSREYIVKEGKFIVPTQLGEEVTDMLVKYFSDIMDVGFTANMESKLDDIEDGGKIWQKVVGEYYNGLEDKIAAAMGDSFSLKAADEVSDVICENCGSRMVYKNGKFGRFLACPNFPKCRNTKALDENGNVLDKENPKQPEQTGVICDKCGSPMVLRHGKFGDFLACSAYPKCKNIKNIQTNEDYGKCPDCGKPLKRIISGKGAFYGCTGYPDCKFTSLYPVSDKKCPDCGGYMVKRSYKGKNYLVCAKKDCGHREETT